MESINQLTEWVEAIQSDATGLSQTERQFINDQMNRIEMYGDRVKFSEKQADWIEAIYKRKVGRG